MKVILIILNQILQELLESTSLAPETESEEPEDLESLLRSLISEPDCTNQEDPQEKKEYIKLILFWKTVIETQQHCLGQKGCTPQGPRVCYF